MNNNPSSPAKYIPISEAAKFLGVSLDTLRRWDKSGVLKSKRLDGKNRYFSLEDLKKNISNRPLSISEVSKKFNISSTTLRRLEARGVIKPSRNKAGERVFDFATIESFTKSQYFERKKHTFKKEKALPKIKQPINQVQVTKEAPLKKELDNKPNSIQAPKLAPKLAPNHFLAISAAAFLLLVTVGLGNVFLFKTQNYELLPLSMVLGEKITAPPLIPMTQNTELEETSSISKEEVKIEEPNTPLEKYLAESLKMIDEKKNDKKSFQSDAIRLVEIATDLAKTGTDSAQINIRQMPDILSPIVGSAGNGEVFEFLSFDSGWVQLRLHESTSSGYIQEQNALIKEFDFTSAESGWSDVNESTESASIEIPTTVKEEKDDQSTN